MTGLELIKEIKKHPNIDLPITISVDYHPEYPYRRVFANELFGINDIDNSSEITILMGGFSNNDMEAGQ